MKSFIRCVVAALPAISQCFALPAEVNSPIPDHVTLHPIAIRDYEAAMGLQRRDSKEFEDLDFKTQTQLIYGSPGYDGQKTLAEMTLYAPDGLQIVSMEKFEPLTSHVDCNDDDGVLSLTFKSKGAYDYALKKWSFINENKDDKFLIITNHAGCGPDDERQPYIVSSVDNKADQQTVLLFAKETPWSEVAGTYDLTFGQAMTNSQSRRLRSRDWWDDVKDGLGDAYEATENAVEEVGEGIADTVQGNADLSKSISFSVAAGSEGQKTQLYKDKGGLITLDCIDCYVKGSFQVTGKLKVEGWKLKDLTLDTSPQGFHAMLKLEATITASNKPKSLGDQKELFSAPVPYAGVRVPKIFKLGAVFAYTVGFNTTFKGEGVVDFGLKATLPDTAKATINLSGPGSSSATGFSGSLQPLFEVKSLSASVSVAAFSEPKLSFGIELEKIGKAEVALGFKLPEVTSTLTASYKAEGVCADDPKKTKTGVDLTNEVKLALSAEVTAELGSDEDSALPNWNKELWAKPFALPGKCWPISIPALLPGGGGGGGGGDDTTTTAAAPPSSTPTTLSRGNTCKVSGESGTCVSTSSCKSSGGKSTPGFCPNDPTDVQCCVQPPASSNTCKVGSTSGKCVSTASCASTGGKSTPGYCPKDPTDVQCCTPKEAKTCKVGSASGTCVSTSSCKSSGGTSTPGYCPDDPTDVQCCTKPPPPVGTCRKVRRDSFGKRIVIPC